MKRPVALRFLTCCDCGSVFPLYRVKGHYRPDGHIKHLWCFRCNARTPHIEAHMEHHAFEGVEVTV